MAEPVIPTTLTLTNQERRVICAALTGWSALMDMNGEPENATTTLELAYRVLPGGLRGNAA